MSSIVDFLDSFPKTGTGKILKRESESGMAERRSSAGASSDCGAPL